MSGEPPVTVDLGTVHRDLICDVRLDADVHTQRYDGSEVALCGNVLQWSADARLTDGSGSLQDHEVKWPHYRMQLSFPLSAEQMTYLRQALCPPRPLPTNPIRRLLRRAGEWLVEKA